MYLLIIGDFFFKLLNILHSCLCFYVVIMYKIKDNFIIYVFFIIASMIIFLKTLKT